jgi:hypothetical protein
MALQAVTKALKAVDPPVGDKSKGAAYLLGGMSLIAGVLALIGVSTDELENIWRNHAFLSHLGIFLIMSAVAVGAIAAYAMEKGTRRERGLLILGNIILAAGLILVAFGGLRLASDSPDPTITVKPLERDGRTLLKVEVKDSKLRANEGLRVFVEPLFEVPEEKRGETKIRYRVGRPLYSATLAPSKDGDVEHSRVVEIPPGTFQNVGVRISAETQLRCYEEKDRSGCLLVRIPQRSEEPQLSFKWRGSGRGAPPRTLQVRALALDVPDRSLRFQAMALKPRKRVLVQATLAPNRHGDVNYVVPLPVKGSKVVCVAASTANDRLTCPPRNGSNPSWARLRVPSSR